MRLKTYHPKLYRLAFFALFLCLWNLFPGMAELAHQGDHERVQAESTSHQETNSMPCSQDCDDENCLDHHCHFGHCQMIETAAFQLSHPLWFDVAKLSLAKKLSSPSFNLLPKPPKA